MQETDQHMTGIGSSVLLCLHPRPEMDGQAVKGTQISGCKSPKY